MRKSRDLFPVGSPPVLFLTGTQRALARQKGAKGRWALKPESSRFSH